MQLLIPLFLSNNCKNRYKSVKVSGGGFCRHLFLPEIPVGFLVDEVVGIKHIDDATIDSTPKVVANEGDFVDSIVKTEDSMIISIDLERVLNINELKALDNFNKENSR